MTSVLKKKRRQRQEKHTGEGHVEDGGRNWSRVYIRAMIPGALMIRKKQGRFRTQNLHRETTPANVLILDVSPPEL